MNIVRPPKPPMVEQVSASEAVEVGSKSIARFQVRRGPGDRIVPSINMLCGRRHLNILTEHW
jgi:hypothetical protein